jgi:hypothetical protein
VGEPTTYDLFRAATRSAIHLEMRDSYTPSDPDWQEWQAGGRFNPAERWRDWYELMRETAARGVAIRRARVVSEPVTDYIRFEYDVTADHNVAAGEQVRWLARHRAADLLVPAVDFWAFDDAVVVFNHFDGVGEWVREERRDDPDLAKLLTASFEAVWDRATPHASYRVDI